MHDEVRVPSPAGPAERRRPAPGVYDAHASRGGQGLDVERSGRDLSMEEREELRTELIGHKADRALWFQTKAVGLFGPAGGIMARQLLFWDTPRTSSTGTSNPC